MTRKRSVPKAIQCPRCAEVLPCPVNFCSLCGADLRPEKQESRTWVTRGATGSTNEQPPVTCPHCGHLVKYYGTPGTPFFHPINFCVECGGPFTDQARRQVEKEQAAAVAAQMATVVNRAIDQVAADLEIDPDIARKVILIWAKLQN